MANKVGRVSAATFACASLPHPQTFDGSRRRHVADRLPRGLVEDDRQLFVWVTAPVGQNWWVLQKHEYGFPGVHVSGCRRRTGSQVPGDQLPRLIAGDGGDAVLRNVATRWVSAR